VEVILCKQMYICGSVLQDPILEGSSTASLSRTATRMANLGLASSGAGRRERRIFIPCHLLVNVCDTRHVCKLCAHKFLFISEYNKHV